MAGLSIGAVVTANRTDSAAVLERGPAHPPPQGRVRGRRAGLHRPAHRRRHPALGLGGGVHRAHRRPPGRGRPAGRRGALRGGGGLAQRGHRPLRRVRQRQRPQRGRRPHPRRAGWPAGSGHQIFTGSSIAIEANGHPLSADMFPHVRTLATGESEDDVVIGVTDGTGRRQWLSLSSRLLSGAGQADVAHGGVLVHRRHRPQGGRGPAPLAGLPRLADRARQPLALQRRARARAAGVDAAGHQPGRAVHRPRPLQAGQRLVRPRQRGRGAAGAGPAVQVGRPRRRRGQPVLAATSSSCCAATSTTSTSPSSLATEYSPAAVRTGPAVDRPQGGGHLQRRRVLRDAGTPDRPRTSSSRPTWPCSRPRTRAGRRVEVFDESLRANSVARLEIYDDLRHSIDHDELAVHYQPIASVRDDRIVAMEALVRWNHPSRGLLGPMEFIPFAEETDLIFSLGRWVLREACQTMATLAQGAARRRGRLHHRQPVGPPAERHRAARLHRRRPWPIPGLPPEALVMEVTESMLMSDTSETIAMLGGIHEMGVGLAIDDFGTGVVVAGPAQAVPGQDPQDRQVLRRRPRDLRERRGHRGRHRPAVQGAGPGGPGRGGGDPGPARAGGRARLRPLPGLPDVPADQRRPRRLHQARPRRSRRQNSARSGGPAPAMPGGPAHRPAVGSEPVSPGAR